MGEPRSAFRQSLPVTITSLVNKAGSIGLSLLPMLLVEGHYSTAESSLAMTLVKGSTLAATVAAGWLSDTIGLRVTVLGSFLLAATGLAGLPLELGFAALVASGVVAQLGITSINATLRLLLTGTVERGSQKEALGWMRLANNLGQVLTFGLATVTATLGARVLIWFDALTSLLAFGIGLRILPRPKPRQAPGQVLASPEGKSSGWGPFIGCALILTGWNFMYELFMVGVSGRLKLLYPVEGLRVFALLMVVNTILCAGLAIVAARMLTRVVFSLSFGVALTAGGVILGTWRTGSVPLLFASILLLTLGEIVYGALGQFLLIRAVPAGRRENTVYSSAILVSNVGRMLAAGLAFPLVVHAPKPSSATWIVLGVGVASLAVLAAGKKDFTRLAEST